MELFASVCDAGNRIGSTLATLPTQKVVEALLLVVVVTLLVCRRPAASPPRAGQIQHGGFRRAEFNPSMPPPRVVHSSVSTQDEFQGSTKDQFQTFRHKGVAAL